MKPNFSQQWLEILCTLIAESNSALFVIPDSQAGQIRSLAKWPTDLDRYDDFSAIVKFALKKQQQVCIPNVQTKDKSPFDFFALPIYIQSELLGVIVIKTTHLPKSQHSAVFNYLQQGAQWLQLASVSNNQNEGFYTHIVGLLAACIEQNSYQECLIRLVTELTQQFNCERVAYADFQQYHCKVIAISNSAGFDARSNLMKKIANAMDEAIEQDRAVIFPDSNSQLIQRAHKDLARKFGSGAICTIPLNHEQNIVGAITLMRSEETLFDTEALILCQQAFALLTPYLVLKRENEKSLAHKTAKTLKKHLSSLFGCKYLKIKLAATAVALLIFFANLIEGDFRVTADAVLEGRIQRVVAAPISGYLLSASAQAGDTIQQGEIIATIDDAEMQLELTKLTGQLQQARREYREALSTRNLVQVRVISAQINQAVAEIELTRQQLDKLHITVPFDGVVIEGDLEQMLGTPVDRGDTLFKIAPLEGYRIILKVDERLISYVKQGQIGSLALSSMPDRKFPLTIEKITAVANADDGANIFRVEASLNSTPELLRPGMEGIGKINAGKARLLWIWTHEMMDWLRLWFWSWLP